MYYAYATSPIFVFYCVYILNKNSAPLFAVVLPMCTMIQKYDLNNHGLARAQGHYNTVFTTLVVYNCKLKKTVFYFTKTDHLL